ERRDGYRADNGDQAQAVVQALGLRGLRLHPRHLIEPAQLEKVPLARVKVGVVHQPFQGRSKPLHVRIGHSAALPFRRSSSKQASSLRSRESTTWSKPDSASEVTDGSARSPRTAAASASAVRPLPSSTTTRRPASMLCRTSSTAMSPPCTSTGAEGSG